METRQVWEKLWSCPNLATASSEISVPVHIHPGNMVETRPHDGLHHSRKGGKGRYSNIDKHWNGWAYVRQWTAHFLCSSYAHSLLGKMHTPKVVTLPVTRLYNHRGEEVT